MCREYGNVGYFVTVVLLQTFMFYNVRTKCYTNNAKNGEFNAGFAESLR